MATIAKLMVELGLDGSGLDRGIGKARASLDNLGSSFRNFGTGLTAGLTVPLVAAGVGLVKWAASAENAVGKTETVFGDSAASVLDWSKTTANALGIPGTQALQTIGTFGGLFDQMGMTTSQSALMGQELIALSADMGAFNDVSSQRASDAIMSGLIGEYESLQSLGVFLNEAVVGEEALAIAMADGRTEITEQDKQLARYNLILEQTTQQQGQFARESNTFNGKLARLSARFRDLGAKLGSHLLGPLSKLMDYMERLMSWFEKLSPAAQKWIVIIAAMAAAIGPLLLALGFMLPAIGAVAAAIAFLVSPIGLIVIAIVALVAGLVYAYAEFETFRNIVNTAASSIVAGFGVIIDGIMALKAAFDAGGWSAVWDKLREGIVSAIDQMRAVIEAFVAYLSARFPALGAVISTVATAVGFVVDAIRTLVNMAIDFATHETTIAVFRAVWDGLRFAIGFVVDAIRAVVNFAISFATHETTIATFRKAWGLLEGAIVWVVSAIETVVGYAISFATHERTIETFRKAWGLLEGAIVFVVSAIKTVVDYAISFATHETTINTFKTVWEKLTDAIGFVSDAIDTVTSLNPDFSAITGPIQDIIDLVQDGIDKWNEFKRLFGGGGDAATSAAASLGGAIGGTLMGAGGLSMGNGQIERQIAQMDALTVSINAAKAAGDNFGTAGFNALKHWATGFMDMTPQQRLFEASLYTMEQAGRRLGDGMTAVGAQVGNSVLMMAASVKGNLGGVSTFTNAEFSGIRSSALSNFLAAQQATSSNTMTMRTVAIANAQAMKTSVSSSADTMKSNVSLAMAGTQAAVALQSMMMMAVAKTQGLVMVQNATSAANAMRSVLTAGAQAAAAGVSAGLGRIPGIVSSVGGQAVAVARSIGANISSAFASGMLSQLGTIQAAANAMVSAAATALIAKAMIASPSKLFMGYGEYVGEGFELGIRSGIPDVMAAARDLVGVPNMTPMSADDWQGHGGGQVINHNNFYAVSPADLMRLLEDSKDGADFARSFGPELAMYGGKP
jgi:phage-related protein